MAEGSPDLVDCARMAEDAAVLERAYRLSELPRLQDLLAEPTGELRARFEFGTTTSGRAGANVAVQAVPQLICQRCMQAFAFPVSAGSDVEFAGNEEAAASDSEREFFPSVAGRVSLRALAEEELLLALPIAAACSTPQSCGNAPPLAGDAEGPAMRRPFSVLQDLLKKT